VTGDGVALVGAGLGEGIGGEVSIGFSYINVALSLHLLPLSPSAVTIAEALIINSEQHSATNGFTDTKVSPSSRSNSEGLIPADQVLSVSVACSFELSDSKVCLTVVHDSEREGNWDKTIVVSLRS
jgi:hypothetical protein